MILAKQGWGEGQEGGTVRIIKQSGKQLCIELLSHSVNKTS